jgi:hypothetical protein
MVFVLVSVGAYWIKQRDAGEPGRIGVPGTPAPEINGGPVSTTGTDKPRGGDDNGGPPAVVPPALIQELETITGSIDGNELVGRRVDLHVNVSDIINDTAFWVGEGDNRVLVVTGRDNRDGSARQQGLPPRHGLMPVQGGQQATISGTVLRLPRAEEMYSWDLTRNDAAELKSRPIYIRADTVTTSGHAES